MRKLLLLSNPGIKPSLFKHWSIEIDDFLGDEIKSLLVIPYAQFDYDEHMARISVPFRNWGVDLYSIHKESNLRNAIENAEGILIPGGNTYKLSTQLNDFSLDEVLVDKINSETPFIGYSAGVNVLGESIHTTNDTALPGFERTQGLGVLPFNFKPHYGRNEGMKSHQDSSAKEFHRFSDVPIVCLPNYTGLKVEGDLIETLGDGVVLKQKGKNDMKYYPSSNLSFLLE